MKTEYTLRHPVVSGLFYPDDREELKNTVRGYMERVDKRALQDLIRESTGLDNTEQKMPLIIIAPHAGYIFSAKVQAYAYALLDNAKIDCAIIIGPAHQKSFPGISVNDDNAYRTPLGDIEVDLDCVEKLQSFHRTIGINEEAHLSEHALEVQLPFIQTVLKDAKIVPILFGEQNWDNSHLLKDALVSAMKEIPKNYIVIVSSDLSHYHPHVEAFSLDRVLLEDVKNMDERRFYDNLQMGKSEACGFGGILTALMLSHEVGQGKSAILNYMDSGEVSNERKKVVGYFAAALY
ncbi:MAG: hypothetical protein AMS17_07210 [Spirochaetes bacterium DG_61]|jgi:AmmeMemoRadiSam system protein B|nr:MAG: hypothetical protein AMS17_07210 [Spirochaetes bacterium DG_61]